MKKKVGGSHSDHSLATRTLLSPTLPYLIVQLFVELGQLGLTLVLLHIGEANPRHVGRGGRLVVEYVVQGLHLCVGLLFIKLLLDWDALA